MTLSPDEIESMEFVVGLRGYDKDAVHAFLKQAAADYREATAALAATHEDADPNARAIDGLASRVEAIVRAATEQAQLILAEAEQEAARIRRDAERVREVARHEPKWWQGRRR